MDRKLEISLLLEFYGQMLSERQRELIDYYYNDDLSLTEISELTGITRQGARDGIKKAGAILETYEEKLGMFRSYRARQSAVKALLTRLARLSEKYSFGSDPDYALLEKQISALAGAEGAEGDT